jgi:hypothetical protein
MPVTTHLLVINTHNRLGTLMQLLSHVQSFDDLFEEILIICDSDDQYYYSTKCLLDLFSIGSNKYKLIQLNCVGGAEARNNIIRNGYVFKFNLVSFCDDDDLPFRVKFESAQKNIINKKDIVGYSPSYIRNYGKVSRKIISKKKFINLDDILKNNDLGGFSFVTLKTKYLNDINLIPVDLKSNQDWYLWMSILYKHKNVSFYKDIEVGLVYDDDRKRKTRLTLDSNNISSTYAFYKYCKSHFNHDNENVLGYYYFKYLRQKDLFDLIKSPLLKNPYLQKKHVISLIKIHFIERIFL